AANAASASLANASSQAHQASTTRGSTPAPDAVGSGVVSAADGTRLRGASSGSGALGGSTMRTTQRRRRPPGSQLVERDPAELLGNIFHELIQLSDPRWVGRDHHIAAALSEQVRQPLARFKD